MQRMYENYSFMFIPIIVDALVHVPKCIFTSIQNLGFTKNETNKLAKICKTFISIQNLQGLSFLDLQPNNFLLIFAIY